MRFLLLLLLTVLPGVAGIIVFGYYALVDWNALQQAYGQFEAAVQARGSLETLFAREAQQNIHRINLFAEGVWTLLSAIVAAIGIHGICTAPRRLRG